MGVDIEDAIARGFRIAFEPALIASLVTYLVRTGWLEAPINWETVGMLRDVAMKSVSLAIVVSLIVAVLVFVWRALKVSMSKGGHVHRR